MAIPPDMLDLAGHIISRMKGSFDPSKFEDRYENALVDLVKAKQSGRTAPQAAAQPKPSNVVNLMDALRKSLAADQASASAPAAGSRPIKKPAAAQAGAEPPIETAPSGAAKPLARSKPTAKAAASKTKEGKPGSSASKAKQSAVPATKPRTGRKSA